MKISNLQTFLFGFHVRVELTWDNRDTSSLNQFYKFDLVNIMITSEANWGSRRPLITFLLSEKNYIDHISEEKIYFFRQDYIY